MSATTLRDKGGGDDSSSGSHGNTTNKPRPPHHSKVANEKVTIAAANIKAPMAIVQQPSSSFLSNGCSVKQQLSQEGWSYVDAHGGWSDASAGGSWDYKTWTKNDQFQLKVLRPCNLVVVLTQISIHLDSHQSIGFYITYGHLMLKKVTSTDVELIAQAPFASNDEVWCGMRVGETSVYNVIPCTREPGVKMEYFLTVFYDVPNDIDSLYVKLHPINQETILPSPRSSIISHFVQHPNRPLSTPPSPASPSPESSQSRPQSTIKSERSPIPTSFSFHSIISSLSSPSIPSSPTITQHPSATSPPFPATSIVFHEDDNAIKVRKEYSTATYNKDKWTHSKATELPGFVYLNVATSNNNHTKNNKAAITSYQILDSSVLSRSDSYLSPSQRNQRICCKELLYEGSWTEDTAGGCAKYGSSFRNNPFYFITSSSIPSTFYVLLKMNTLHTNLFESSLGLYILKTDPEGRRPLYLTKKNVVASLIVKNSNQILMEVEVLNKEKEGSEGWSYCIVPCTELPSIISSFTLSIFYCVLDSESPPPPIFYIPPWDWFKSSCKGNWRDSLGGTQHYSTMRNNFNVFLTLEATSSITIILTQENDEYEEGERTTNSDVSGAVQRMTARVHAVGFYLINGTTLNGDLISDSEFHRSQEVVQKLMVLSTGDYTIIPTCLEANTRGCFTITVYSDTPAKLYIPNKKGNHKTPSFTDTPKIDGQGVEDSNIENRIDEINNEPLLGEAKKSSEDKDSAQQQEQQLLALSQAALIAQQERRTRIVREIYETEKSYVEGLIALQTWYIDPFKKESTSPGGFLTEEQCDSLFQTVEPIIEFNSRLLEAIQSRLVHWLPSDSRIADIFLQHYLRLKSYADHTNNFTRAIELLQSLQKSKKYTTFLDSIRKTNFHILTIESYLIMPIQRVPRYVMLLKELVKFTPMEHADYLDCVAAAGKLQEIATYLNEKKREHENLEKLRQVIEKIPFLDIDFVSNERKWIREGPIYFVVGGLSKRKERGLAILCSDILLYINQKKSVDERIVLDDDIDLESNDPSTPAAFSLVSRSSGKNWIFVATMTEEKLSWVVDIKSTLQQNSQL